MVLEGETGGFFTLARLAQLTMVEERRSIWRSMESGDDRERE
jgi:hypothetical protein